MEEKVSLTPMARIGLKTILWSLGLSIVFFVPFLPLNLIYTKGILLTFGAAIGLVMYLVDSITVGRFVLPRGKAWKVYGGVVLAAIVSAFFTPNKFNSLFGSGFETYTALTLFISFIYFFLISVWGQSVNLTKYIIKSIYLSGFIALIFSLVQFFFNLTGRFSKAFMGLVNGNLVGTFHDFGIFLAVFIILLLISLENNFWRGWMKVVSTLALVLTLAFLLMINYTFLWYLVGLTSFSIIIYKLMPDPKKISQSEADLEIKIKNRNFSVISFLVTFCAFIGIIASSSINQFFVSKNISLSSSEPRPTILANLTITKNAYYHNPILGAGLNRFNEAWEMGKHKIMGGKLIGSDYWNTSLFFGTGIFFTFVTVLGLVAGALFVWLTVIIIKEIISLFSRSSIANSKTRDLLVFGSMSIFLMVLFLFDVPNAALFVLTMAFFGMLFAFRQSIKKQNPKEIVFINDYRHSFFGISGTLVAIIFTVLGLFIISRAFYAAYLVNRATISSVNTKDYRKTIDYIVRAENIYQTDSYARLLVDAQILRLNSLLSDNTVSQDVLKNDIKDSLTSAVAAAKLAIQIDSKNYQNHVYLLKIQEALLTLGDETVYDEAIKTANQILTLTPNNIGIILRQAKISAYTKNYEAARSYIDQILAINPYFIDAYMLRSQIALQEGDSVKAISELDQAENKNPRSAVLQYQKGLIYMNQTNYGLAAESFENALRLAPNSLDVYSSLALAYEKLGQKDNVIRTLELARNYIVDKTQINELIEKVKNGGSLVTNDASSDVKTKEDSKTESKKSQ